MCKIFVIPHIPKDKQDAVNQLFIKLAKPMSKDDTDGLGYAFMKSNGELVGERWLENASAFKHRVNPELNASQKKLKEKYGHMINIPLEEKYNKFGTLTTADQIVSGFLHTRKATSGKGLKNTHPFLRPQKLDDEGKCHNEPVALIHNGVITNAEYHKWKDKKLTECDSEVILISYLENGAHWAPEKMQKVADDLYGYYAFAAMTLDYENVPIMDIVRDGQAQLFIAHIPALGTEVFFTNPEIVNDALKDMKNKTKDDGWCFDGISFVASNSHLRVNSLTGEVMHYSNFTKSDNYGNRGNGYHGGYNGNGGESSTGTTVVKPPKEVPLITAENKPIVLGESKKPDEKHLRLIRDMSDAEFEDYKAAQDMISADQEALGIEDGEDGIISDDPVVIAAYMQRMRSH